MTTLDPGVVLTMLQERERTLSNELATIHARLDEVHDLIQGLMARCRKPGRPRKEPLPLEMPQRLDGSAHEPDDPPDNAA